MNFIAKIKSRKNDMKTLSDVMEASLAQAATAGESIAGAHHLALATFDMDDGLASEVLTSLGSSAEAFASSLRDLDSSTLAELGIDDRDVPTEPVQQSRLGKTDATYDAAIKATYDFHNGAKQYTPLRSAHLLAGVASVEHGKAARVFADLNLDRQQVIDRCLELC